jgi:hypothetical protein
MDRRMKAPQTRTLAQREDMTCGLLTAQTRLAADLIRQGAPPDQLMALADTVRDAAGQARIIPGLGAWVARFQDLETDIRARIPTQEVNAP